MRRAQWRRPYKYRRRQCDDSFPEKKGPFNFNNPRNPDTESRRQKVGSLKYFEIRGVPEKELPTTDKKLLTHSAWSFTRSKNEVLE
jgi:hypothetical protein